MLLLDFNEFVYLDEGGNDRIELTYFILFFNVRTHVIAHNVLYNKLIVWIPTESKYILFRSFLFHCINFFRHYILLLFFLFTVMLFLFFFLFKTESFHQFDELIFLIFDNT